jgi:CRISPR-associated protein Csb1
MNNSTSAEPAAPVASVITDAQWQKWANDLDGPVALHLREVFVPVEGDGGVVFPPTYAGEKSGDEPRYNLDELSDGTKVVTIDSVASQANRMEPIFAHRYPDLVPQITIACEDGRELSVLEDAGHRLGDALIRCTDLIDEAHEAFAEFKQTGKATKIAKLSPTSLVFGAWDSRDTGAKLPRIVQSVVRAWDVEELERSAQFTPAVDYSELGVVSDKEKEKAEGNPKDPLAQRGFVHVPAKARGGVVVRGRIERQTTVNLIALRRLKGDDDETLRAYVLGLALLAAVEPMEAFLRQGCLLVADPNQAKGWTAVERSGKRQPIGLTPDHTLELARAAAKRFGVAKPRTVVFDKELAKADVQKAKKGG